MLRATFLASLLIPLASLVSTALPVHDDHPIYVSNQHDKHAARVKTALKAPSDKRVRPGEVHMYDIAGTDGHMSGSVLVDPHHVKGMTVEELHVHAEVASRHIREHMPAGSPQYHVLAHHKKGDAHVMIHAVPNSHVTTTKTEYGRNAMVLASHPNRPRPNAPRLPSHQRDIIKNALFQHHDPNSGTGKHHLFTEGAPLHSSHPGAHGPVRPGTIPVADPYFQPGMSAGALHMHAEWIHENLVPSWQQHQVHIHAKHFPGDEHVEYKIVPARNHVTTDEVQSFLNNRDNSQFNIEPFHRGANGRPGHNQLNFRGAMPAHTRGTMDTSHLNTYAAHARAQIIGRHQLEGDDADGMSMSTAHKAEQKEVRYHTQPKTEKILKRLEEVGYPAMSDAMHAAGLTTHTVSGQVIPWRHSDEAVLEDAARLAGVTNKDDGRAFKRHVNGYVLGNAGQGDRPCNTCHAAFKQLNAGVTYTDMHRW